MSTRIRSDLTMTGAYPEETRPAPPATRRRTKIVCTLGPATTEPQTILELAARGMDAARLNFSHGKHEEHLARLQAVRAAQERLGRPLAVIADLCGPKIRVADFPGTRDVRTGELVTFCPPGSGEPDDIEVTFSQLSEVVDEGSTILIDDGKIRTRVVERDRSRIRARVEVGGTILPNKGVNLPNTNVPIPSLTEKDMADLEFIVQQDIDYVALSFVQTPQDVEDLRDRLRAAGSDARTIAKVEKAEAVENLDGIIEVADAVMVARGDLGVEMGVAKVPLIQKRMIASAREAGKTVITATQMLESMIHAPEPTRAEAADVANAIIDGTSAVMLSAETASGEFPLDAVRVMDTIAREVEPSMAVEHRGLEDAPILTVLTHSACEIADEVDAPVIAVPTESGTTAREVSRFRPQRPIASASSDVLVLQQLALDWGVVPMAVPPAESIEETWTQVVRGVRAARLASTGDIIVIVSRMQTPIPGRTSHVAVHRLAD